MQSEKFLEKQLEHGSIDLGPSRDGGFPPCSRTDST